MKVENLYKKQNNIFQSEQWLGFQNEYGRKIIKFSNCFGIELGLPFGRKGIWIQKAPEKISKSLISEFQETGADFVRIEPAKLCESDIKDYKLKYVSENSLLCGQKSPKATQVIDLAKSEEDVLAGMKSKTRYNIRLAIKRGVVVEVEDSEKVLFELLSKTAERQKGYYTHPREYYKKLLGQDSCKVFVAYREKKPVAAILVSIYGEVVTYLHGGFSDEDRKIMAPYLCHMEAIEYAKKQGCKYYDMWGVAETDDKNDPWAGITRFKQGFGGEKAVFSGSYDYINNKFWYNTLTLLARVRKVARR